MNELIQEIRAAIARLKREGEFDKYITNDADEKAAEIALRFQRGLELSDHEVETLWLSLPQSAQGSPEAARREAEDAIERITSRRPPSTRPGDQEGKTDPRKQVRDDPSSQRE
jgi:hypothetical protein